MQNDIQALMQQMTLLYAKMGEITARMEHLVDEEMLDAKLEEKLEEKFDAFEQRMKTYYDLYTDRLIKDFRGASTNQIQVVEDKVQKHEIRITKIEHVLAA